MLYSLPATIIHFFDNFPQFSATELKPSVHDDRTLTTLKLQDGVNAYILKELQAIHNSILSINKFDWFFVKHSVSCMKNYVNGTLK